MATPTSLSEALEILNEARVNLGYQDQPEITAENLAEFGVLPPNQLNKYIDGINLILEQRTFRNMFDSSKNPIRKFFMDIGRYGFGIKDIMIEFIDGVVPMWDESNTDEQVLKDLVSYAEDKLLKKYHEDKMERQFKASIDEREYSKMFTDYGLPRFIDGKIANLASSAEYWLLNQVTGLIKEMIENQDVVVKSGYELQTTQGIKNAVETVRAITEGVQLPTNLYNKAGIVTMANSKDDVFIFTTPDILERVRVQDLSGAYNLDLANLPGNLVLVPNGTDLGTDPESGKDALFVILDRKALVLGIRTWRMTNFLVPNTLKHNNWLSVEGLKSYNTFMSAVAVCGDFDDFQD